MLKQQLTDLSALKSKQYDGTEEDAYEKSKSLFILIPQN